MATLNPGTYRIAWSAGMSGDTAGQCNDARLSAGTRNGLTAVGVDVLSAPFSHTVDINGLGVEKRTSVGVRVRTPISTQHLDTAWWTAMRDAGLSGISITGMVGHMPQGLSGTGEGPGLPFFRTFRQLKRTVTPETEDTARVPRPPPTTAYDARVIDSSEPLDIGREPPSSTNNLAAGLRALGDALRAPSQLSTTTKLLIGVGVGVASLVAVGYAIRSVR